MARPLKKGLSYFPLDTDFLSDRKIQRLSQKYGCNGISIYIATLCEIYRENGYYVNYNPDFCFDIGFTLHLGEELVQEVIGYCVQIRLFDSKLMEFSQTLSSAAIQRRYREVYRRNQPVITPDLQLSETMPFQGVIATETPVVAAKTSIIATETPVIATKTPTKGKGKGKENKKERTINSTRDEKSEGDPFRADSHAAIRRAELLRMAADATAGQ